MLREADGAGLEVAERGSNLGALRPEDVSGSDSILCRLFAADPLDAVAAGAACTCTGRALSTVVSVGAESPFCLGACLLSCCAFRFCTNRALAVCFGRFEESADEPAAGAKLSMSPSSLSSMVRVAAASFGRCQQYCGCFEDKDDGLDLFRNAASSSRAWLRVLLLLELLFTPLHTS